MRHGRRRRAGLAFALLALAAAGLRAAEPSAADLASIFSDWPAWSRGAEALAGAIERFAQLEGREWRGAPDLLAALRARDEVRREAARVDGYLTLRLDLDARDEESLAHRPRMDALSARWDAASAWFQPRLQAVAPATLASWLAAEPALVPYRWQLASALQATPRPLGAAELEILRLADLERQTTARVHTALTVTEGPRITVRLQSGQPFAIDAARARRLAAELADPRDRAAARRAWLAAVAARAATTAALFEGLVRREGFAARAQGFAGPLEAALAADDIPAPVVRQVLAAARGAAPVTARWHAARKRRLGLARYGVADIEAPLPGAPVRWSWDQARAQVLAAVAPLGPEIAGRFARAFDDGWIDAVERPAKRPIGFSTFVYGDHPFVSVIFRGTTADLFSLVHELAHAVHHSLACDAQPYSVARPSTLVGETAAAVAESLLVRHLARHAGSPGERAAFADLEARSIHRFFLDPTLNADFELAAHETATGLSASRLGDLYRERLLAFHGGALDLEPGDGNGWLETPHFFSAPFSMARYSLSYAAAVSLVDSLASGPDEPRAAARKRYLALLQAGASAAPLELLATVGADLREPATLAAVPRRLAELAEMLER